MKCAFLAFGWACALALATASAPLLAQTPDQSSPSTAAPSSADPLKALLGAWELSNADRDMTCSLTLKAAPRQGASQAIEWDKGCGGVFPITKEVTGWTIGKNDAIQFLDARGRILLELTEVETGLYEGLRPGDPLYFLQNQASLGVEKTAQDMAGEWAVMRGSRQICVLTLSSDTSSADFFVVTVKPGCDSAVAAFSPAAWRMDRGQLLIQSAKGEAWRFEEGDTGAWQRIPAGRQPLSLMRQ